MKFSPRCRTKKLEIIYIILGSIYSFFNWEGADIRFQIRPKTISEECQCDKDHVDARKPVFGGLQTIQAQTSLCIRAV